MGMNTLDNNKKRICMIVQQPDVQGGIAAVTSGYYGSVLEQDYDIRYVESYCNGSKLKKLTKALKGYAEFSKVLREFKPELVHMHTSFGASFYRMQPFLFMAKKRGIPVVDHLHGADFKSFYTEASDKKKAKIKKIYGKFDRIIVLSEEWKTTMSEVVSVDKMTVIENYAKPLKEDEVEPLVDKRFADKKVLFLGELGQRKGGYDFADIVKEAQSKDPDIKFIFCGSGSEADEKAIKEAVCGASKSNREKISFPGWVRGADKDKFLREAALFMLPSYQEGLPMSILDAMGYGLPIVSTEVGGIPQLVDEGVSGKLSKAGDTKAIGSAIADLLKDRNKYEAASKASLSIARERFGFDAHVKRLERVYEEILK